MPTVYLSRNYSRPHVAERVRRGQWEQVRRGAYVDRVPDEPLYVRGRRLAVARIISAVGQTAADVVVCQDSAALIQGLPLLTKPQQIHIAQPSRPTRHGAPDIARHHVPVSPEESTVLHGLRVTTQERTLVDCAQALPPLAALVVADAALHVGANLTICAEILRSRAGQRGVVQAREVLKLADSGAESPGETKLRFTLLELGLPVPETQIRISTPRGVFWSDLGWREAGVLCEYDGVMKYAANGAASEAVIREKRRQDALEEEGWRVIRVDSADLRSPQALLDRIRRLMPGVPLTPRPLLHTR